jgi:hypothetical protein
MPPYLRPDVARGDCWIAFRSFVSLIEHVVVTMPRIPEWAVWIVHSARVISDMKLWRSWAECWATLLVARATHRRTVRLETHIQVETEGAGQQEVHRVRKK